MRGKRGGSVGWGFLVIMGAFLGAILLGVAVFGFNLTNSVLSQDIDLGNGVNLKTISDLTFGKINTAVQENADGIGVILLFGMCLFMIVNGFFFGEQYPKIFIIVDLILIVGFFIISAYVTSTYQTFINSTELLQSTYTDVIPKTSKFILNLPVIMGTVGILTMIVSYSGLNKRRGGGEFAVQEF